MLSEPQRFPVALPQKTWRADSIDLFELLDVDVEYLYGLFIDESCVQSEPFHERAGADVHAHGAAGRKDHGVSFEIGCQEVSYWWQFEKEKIGRGSVSAGSPRFRERLV